MDEIAAEDKDRIQHNLKKIHAKKDYQKKFSQRLLLNAGMKTA